MQAIWKFPLTITDAQTVAIPEGAEILTAQMQGGISCLWAIVKDDAPTTDRVIEIFGTGNPMWADMGVSRKYIATVQQGPLVWHVFESR